MTAGQATGSDAIEADAIDADAIDGDAIGGDARAGVDRAVEGDASGPRRSIARRWRGLRRRLRRFRWVALVPTLVVVATLGSVWALTPSASDAPDRVRALAALHHADPLATVLPDRVAAAVLAVEDHRFYGHHGLDTYALPRAVWGGVSGDDRGGSTIEVQLAKWLYTGGHRDHLSQAQQVVLAYKLDLAYSKSQVLLMYLNTVYFGHGLYGVQAASRGYFGRSPDQLDWAQAALLAGLLKAPGSYDPRDHPATARERRDYALSRLADVGTITAAERAEFASYGLELVPG
jgi:penicillin-binding protein 1A